MSEPRANSALMGESPAADAVGARAYREAVDAFGDVAAAIGQLREQDELLHLVASKICALVDVPRCSVYLRDGATGLFRGQVGNDETDIDDPVKKLICGTEADGFTREIVETQAPVVIRNARTDPRPVRSAMRNWNVVSMMGVPMIIGGSVTGLIFLDAKEEEHEFSLLDEAIASTFADLAAVAISQSRLYNEVRASHETVARQNEALRRAAALDDKLTNLVLKGCDLRQVAEAVTELTRKPCAIHDAENRQLAAAAPKDVEASPPVLLEPAWAGKEEIAEALAALAPGKPAVVGPFRAAGLPTRFMVAPVTVRDDHWGTLVLSESGGHFSSFDMLIARRSATVIALEISAERRASNAEWNARSSLAGELIRGNRNTADLESRAQFLGMALHRPHLLCLLTARADSEIDFPDARTAAAAFRREAPDAAVLATEVAEGTAAIVELPNEESELAGIERLKELTRKVCRHLDSSGEMVASLSTVCRGPGDYERAYGQAREVISCLNVLGSTDVLAASDLGAARLFLANAEAAEIDRFAEETLGGLLRDDVQPELLPTLSRFFECGRSVRRAALELDVHENTIRYRLAAVEKAVGLDVIGDAEAQLSAQIALLVLRFRGSLPGQRPD